MPASSPNAHRDSWQDPSFTTQHTPSLNRYEQDETTEGAPAQDTILFQHPKETNDRTEDNLTTAYSTLLVPGLAPISRKEATSMGLRHSISNASMASDCSLNSTTTAQTFQTSKSFSTISGQDFRRVTLDNSYPDNGHGQDHEEEQDYDQDEHDDLEVGSYASFSSMVSSFSSSRQGSQSSRHHTVKGAAVAMTGKDYDEDRYDQAALDVIKDVTISHPGIETHSETHATASSGSGPVPGLPSLEQQDQPYPPRSSGRQNRRHAKDPSSGVATIRDGISPTKGPLSSSPPSELHPQDLEKEQEEMLFASPDRKSIAASIVSDLAGEFSSPSDRRSLFAHSGEGNCLVGGYYNSGFSSTHHHGSGQPQYSNLLRDAAIIVEQQLQQQQQQQQQREPGLSSQSSQVSSADMDLLHFRGNPSQESLIPPMSQSRAIGPTNSRKNSTRPVSSVLDAPPPPPPPPQQQHRDTSATNGSIRRWGGTLTRSHSRRLSDPEQHRYSTLFSQSPSISRAPAVSASSASTSRPAAPSGTTIDPTIGWATVQRGREHATAHSVVRGPHGIPVNDNDGENDEPRIERQSYCPSEYRHNHLGEEKSMSLSLSSSSSLSSSRSSACDPRSGSVRKPFAQGGPLKLQHHPTMQPHISTGQDDISMRSMYQGFHPYQQHQHHVRHDFRPGVMFEYYQGEWDWLPNFDEMRPDHVGIVGNFMIDDTTEAELFRPRRPILSSNSSRHQAQNQNQNQNQNQQQQRRRLAYTESGNFAVRFTTHIDVVQDGVYSFFLSSNDGSVLYIANTLVVENDGMHYSTEVEGRILLTVGKHPVSVEFFHKNGKMLEGFRSTGPSLVVSWRVPGPVWSFGLKAGPKRLIKSMNLFYDHADHKTVSLLNEYGVDEYDMMEDVISSLPIFDGYGAEMTGVMSSPLGVSSGQHRKQGSQMTSTLRTPQHHPMGGGDMGQIQPSMRELHVQMENAKTTIRDLEQLIRDQEEAHKKKIKELYNVLEESQSQVDRLVNGLKKASLFEKPLTTIQLGHHHPPPPPPFSQHPPYSNNSTWRSTVTSVYVDAEEEYRPLEEYEVEESLSEIDDVNTSDDVLAKHIADLEKLKQMYFFSMALSVKMNCEMMGKNTAEYTTTSVQRLYEDCTVQSKIPVEGWPGFVSRHFSKQAALSAALGMGSGPSLGLRGGRGGGGGGRGVIPLGSPLSSVMGARAAASIQRRFN